MIASSKSRLALRSHVAIKLTYSEQADGSLGVPKRLWQSKFWKTTCDWNLSTNVVALQCADTSVRETGVTGRLYRDGRVTI